MNLFLHLLISIFCAFAIYVFSVYEYIWKTNISSEPDSALLVIGILSARENFFLREAIRSTWLKQYLHQKNNSLQVWFIVGKDDCKIPSEYRLSKYGCNKWNVNATGLSDYFYTSHEINNESCTSENVFKQGFSFKVNYPVIIKRLGILSNLLAPNIQPKVAILNIQTKEILVQTTISRNSSHFWNGYLYGDVESVLLPKHFEGMVLVEGYLLLKACTSILWNDGGGILTFNRIYSTPSHTDSIEFSDNIYSAVSIEIYVHDLNGLKTIISHEDKITNEWLKDLKITNQRIAKERSEKQDILIVNITDTYRNVPVKLLEFYKWIDQNYKFSYLMKTDDDTVVDIDRLITHMEGHSEFKSDKTWIWSWFRKEWPVNYIGKWADYDYRSPIYPSFPCGATYLMSHKTVQWLSLNRDYLFPYQGEDVSMGIWLSAIKPHFIDDELFECDSTCSKQSYNRAQLTADKINQIWSMFETCQNLCSCD